MSGPGTPPSAPPSPAAASTEPASTGSPPPPDPRASTDSALLSGIAWTALGKWSTQLLTWVSTLIVARILLPEDFGILGLALVYLGFVYLINELGLGAAVIHNRALTERQLSQLTSVSLVLGLFFAGVSVALSWPIAAFFSEPAIQPVIVVMSIALVTSGLQVVPRSLLTRDLQFRTLAIIEGIQALTAASLTLVLALAGFGYWALVLGNLMAKAIATAVVLRLRFQPFAWPGPLREVLPELRFGGHMSLANVGWYVYGNADAIIIGRLLGTAPLGAYSMAANLANAPITQVTALLSRVTAGIFSAVQDDVTALHRYIHALLQGQALIIFPAATGLVLVAPDFVHLVLGDRWASMIVPLQLLAAAAAVRCLAPVLVQALVFTGHPAQNSRITLIAAAVLPVCFLLGSRWGIVGVAAAWLVGYSLIVFPIIVAASRKHLGLDVGLLAKSLIPGLACTAVMALAVMSVGRAISALPLGLVLGTKIGVGIAAYALAVRILYWGRVRSFVGMVRRARPAA